MDRTMYRMSKTLFQKTDEWKTKKNGLVLLKLVALL